VKHRRETVAWGGNAKLFWDALKGAALQHFESSLVIFAHLLGV